MKQAFKKNIWYAIILFFLNAILLPLIYKDKITLTSLLINIPLSLLCSYLITVISTKYSFNSNNENKNKQT
jgi:hypothetical protein